MRSSVLKNVKPCCFGLLLVIGILPTQLRAQSVWDKIKQKAKEATQQGQPASSSSQRQGQQPSAAGEQPGQQGPQQTQAQQDATQVASAAAPADPQATSAASGDCCSGDAQKKSATAASFLDIVGIKLGMTPQQATAAIKAYNASYKTWVVNTRLQRPSQSNFTPVPRFIFVQSPNLNPSNGQVEHITIEFTTPPNPPVVQGVERYVAFHVGEPILASNLMNSFRQKYGQENSGSPGGPKWVYDANGKLLIQVPNAALTCQPTGNLDAYIVQSDLTHDAQDGGINLSNTVDGQGVSNGIIPACVPYIYAEAWGTGVTPNDKVTQMRVSIRSGALTYNSMKATHNWLQSEADAIRKKQDSDAAGRAGPKL